MIKKIVIALLFLLLSSTIAISEESEEIQKIDELMRSASEAEKVEDCETAYNLYNSALGEVELLDQERYKNKIKELRSILTTKLYKLQPCFNACNPSERQKALFERAKSLSEEGQRKRMVQILRRMLVGKNEKCSFWKKVRAFLNTVPGEESINENADPCEAKEELKNELNQTRDLVKELKSKIPEYTKLKKNEFTKRIDPLIDLFRSIEEARLKIYQLREEFLDCDEIYNNLAEDSKELKSMYEETRDIIISGYKGLVSDMASRISALKKELKLKDEEIEKIKDEYIKLKTKFDQLSQFNEQIFNDLFALANIESVRPSMEMQGKDLSAIFDNINDIIKDQKKVMDYLKQKYPEYFENGANIEALKRKQFVIDKMAQLLSRYKDTPYGQTIGYNRTIDELNATSKMMDSIIKNASIKEGTEKSRKDSKTLIIILIAMTILGLLLLITGILIMKRKKESL